jgi:hypothetical protein
MVMMMAAATINRTRSRTGKISLMARSNAGFLFPNKMRKNLPKISRTPLDMPDESVILSSTEH